MYYACVLLPNHFFAYTDIYISQHIKTVQECNINAHLSDLFILLKISNYKKKNLLNFKIYSHDKIVLYH